MKRNRFELPLAGVDIRNNMGEGKKQKTLMRNLFSEV